MESKAKLFGHPIHQMLIVFPLGLLATSIIFDIVFLITHNGQWAIIAFWLIAAGVIGGLVAAPFGLVDWLAIPAGTRAKRIGGLHGLINVVVLILFGTGWLVRNHAPATPDGLCLGLSFAGLILAAVSGWLGGELVDRLGVGVDPGANVNAPSSLSHPSAQENPGHSPQVK